MGWENEPFAHEDSFAPTAEEKEKASASIDTEETGLQSAFTEEELEHRRLMAEELKGVQRYNMHKEGFFITEDIVDSLVKGGGIISYSKDQSDIKERHVKLTRPLSTRSVYKKSLELDDKIRAEGLNSMESVMSLNGVEGIKAMAWLASNQCPNMAEHTRIEVMERVGLLYNKCLSAHPCDEFYKDLREEPQRKALFMDHKRQHEEE